MSPFHYAAGWMMFLAIGLCLVATAGGHEITWGGLANNDWQTVTNWNAFFDPYPVIVQRAPGDGDTAMLADTSVDNVVLLSANTAWIDGLTVMNGFTLDSNGYRIGVDAGGSALTRIDGPDTRIIVDRYTTNPSIPGLDVDELQIRFGGWLSMNDGRADIDTDCYIDGASEIVGNGRVVFTAGAGVGVVNDGTIRVGGAVPGSLDKTLTIEAPNGTSLDLDGQFFEYREWGVLDVDDGTGLLSGNMTLVVDAPLADPFEGDIYIGRGDTLEIQQYWPIDGGTIQFSGSGGNATLRTTGTGAGLSIDSARLHVTSGTAVIDAFSLLVNTIVEVDATLQVDGEVGMYPGSDLDLNQATALIVNGELGVNQEVVDLDGDSGTVQVTVGSGGMLTLNVDRIDNEGFNFGGTMSIAGVLDANVRGIADSWGLDGEVELVGGELQGTTLVTAGSGLVRGHGRIVAVGLENNGTITAAGGTLVLDSPGNTYDLDGLNGTGRLNAISGNLDIREGGLTFHGRLDIGPSRRVDVEGQFTLRDDFGPGVMNLDDAMLVATGNVSLFGNLEVQPGGSRITSGATLHFAEESNSLINGVLTLDANNGTVLHPGGTYSGSGRLVNPDGKALGLDEGVTVGVTVENRGRLSLGFGGGTVTGEATVQAYEQTAAGTLQIELGGTAAGEYDQLDVNALAQLDGSLKLFLVDLGGGMFAPEIGDAWQIVQAGTVSGEFYGGLNDAFAALPSDRVWNLDYEADYVLLQVLALLSADFDGDGDVDGLDFLIWQRSFGVDDGGDADGDGDTDGEDFLAWQTQFGSSAGEGSSVIPEPNELLLFGILMLVLVGNPWRELLMGHFRRK